MGVDDMAKGIAHVFESLLRLVDRRGLGASMVSAGRENGGTETVGEAKPEGREDVPLSDQLRGRVKEANARSEANWLSKGGRW
jgi:hypothetical protein